MDRYRELGEYTLILLTGAEPCIAPEDERRKAVVGFRRVAEAAAERQVKVAIEPVRNIGLPGSLVWSVREAAELVSECRSSPGAEPPRRSSLVWQTSI
jgi:hydroxypyruvate isomerase